MKRSCKDNIKWGSILPQEEWLRFGALTVGERRKFFREHNLQYRNVPRCSICHRVFFNCEVFLGKEENHDKYWKKHKENISKLNLPFDEKLSESIALVKRVMTEHEGKRIYLAYSGGIDSECCVQLFKDEIANGKVTVVIGDTLVAFPESRMRWEELMNEIPTGKFVITRPKVGISFKIISSKYGLPVYSRSSGDKDKRVATNKCCSFLKKKPMKKVTQDADVLILGLRAEENKNRRLGIFCNGNYIFSKTSGVYRVYPIGYWTIDDVWKFQELKQFKYNRIYDNTNCSRRGFYKLPDGEFYQIRTGCWCCPQSIMGGYLEWLENYYPRFYDALVNKLGMKRHVIWAKVEEKREELKNKKIKPCGEPL